ncbi:hypothetical protein JCM8547_007475 [Rhodosporidiobolus lusitaniae]
MMPNVPDSCKCYVFEKEGAELTLTFLSLFGGAEVLIKVNPCQMGSWSSPFPSLPALLALLVEYRKARDESVRLGREWRQLQYRRLYRQAIFDEKKKVYFRLCIIHHALKKGPNADGKYTLPLNADKTLHRRR